MAHQLPRICKLIGEKASLNFRTLPNTKMTTCVAISDSFGTKFTSSFEKNSDSDGNLHLSEKEISESIAFASNPRPSSFILNEFSAYNIDVTVGNKHQRVTFDSGVGNVIAKEEWRDGIIGNLFYPVNGGPHKGRETR